MIKKVKLSGIITALIISLTPATAFAFNPFYKVNCSNANNSAVCQQSAKPSSNPFYGSSSLLGHATLFIALIGGIAAIILLIIGGIRYATAAGNPEQANGAKRTITYALIGIAIIALAEIIVNFVINNG